MTCPSSPLSTDGVDTKVAIAQAMDIHDTIGYDLVGMVVHDIVVVGAEPLYMTDYIATGKVVPERIADIVRGIAGACRVAGPHSSAARPPNTPACSSPRVRRRRGRHRRRREPPVPARSASLDGDVAVGASRRAAVCTATCTSLVRRVVASAGWEWDVTSPTKIATWVRQRLEPTRIYTKPFARAHTLPWASTRTP